MQNDSLMSINASSSSPYQSKQMSIHETVLTQKSRLDTIKKINMMRWKIINRDKVKPEKDMLDELDRMRWNLFDNGKKKRRSFLPKVQSRDSSNSSVDLVSNHRNSMM